MARNGGKLMLWDVVEAARLELRGTEEFEAALDRDVLPTLFRETLHDISHESKQILRVSGGLLDEEHVGRTVGQRLAAMLESSGQGYRSVFQLSKAEVLAISERDRKTGETLFRRADYYAHIGAQLNEQQVVGDVFDVASLETAYRKFFD